MVSSKDFTFYRLSSPFFSSYIGRWKLGAKSTKIEGDCAQRAQTSEAKRLYKDSQAGHDLRLGARAFEIVPCESLPEHLSLRQRIISREC